MSTRILVALVSMAVVLLVLISRVDAPDSEPVVSDAPLLASLNVAEIERIDITAGNNRHVVSLVQSDSSWTNEQSGYPANKTAVDQLLNTLSTAQKTEAKTQLPEKYPLLGVADISNPDAGGLEFRINDGEVIIIAGYLNDDGQYVRLSNSPQSWLIDAQFPDGRDTTDWLNTLLLDIPAARIQRVRIVRPDNREPLALSKDSPEQLVFQTSDGSRSAAGSALAALRFASVRKELSSNTPVSSAEFVTFDGLVVNTRTTEHADGLLTTFSAAFSEEQNRTFAAEAAAAAVQAEAAQINERLGGWAYTLDARKNALLTGD